MVVEGGDCTSMFLECGSEKLALCFLDVIVESVVTCCLY